MLIASKERPLAFSEELTVVESDLHWVEEDLN
jgi:hypothetical protein